MTRLCACGCGEPLTSPSKDPIEVEYDRAIRMADDTDEAYELSLGLSEYRARYKDRF